MAAPSCCVRHEDHEEKRNTGKVCYSEGINLRSAVASEIYSYQVFFAVSFTIMDVAPFLLGTNMEEGKSDRNSWRENEGLSIGLQTLSIIYSMTLKSYSQR